MAPEKAFIAVVEAGSFKRAAEHLGVESSSLSRKVAALERRLEVKLLKRSTTSTQPTELGQAYYEGLRRIVDEQGALEEEISGCLNYLSGKLRVGATVDFGERFVAPVVASLQESAPALSIELIFGSELHSLGEQNLDVAFRLGPLPDSNLVARALGYIPRVLVASREYLHRHGVPREPRDLAEHRFVLYANSQAKRDIVFSDGQRFAAKNIHSRLAVNSLRAMREMLLSTAGISWGPEWFYREDIAVGRLVELLPDNPTTPFDVYAVYPNRVWLPRKTQEVIRLVGEGLRDSLG